MVDAICRELEMRRDELQHPIRTIYFGGGTPSVLHSGQVAQILDVVGDNFASAKDTDVEITLEANPDDLTEDKLAALAKTKINRLSIGVQSFRESDLKLMNRAHNAEMAVVSIEAARQYFNNLSIDLIYGIPDLSDDQWRANLQQAIDLDVPHISSYALTVEDGTALKRFIEKGVVKPVDDEAAARHFEILLEMMNAAGYEHYEFSNFGRSGYFSQNNLAYWTGKPYVGIGPSAHTYDGDRRRGWNKANNMVYMKEIEAHRLPIETETLSLTDKYNELVMTRLRTVYGISLAEVEADYGETFAQYLREQARPYIADELLEWRDGNLHVTHKGKFLSDGIASGLFKVGLGYR